LNVAEKILMLALSPTMESGIISKWLKQEGDTVASGDVICEVETDKATMDYESSAVGVLLKIVLPAGSSASVGDLIAVIGKSGEDIAGLLASSEGSTAKMSPAESAAEAAATATAGSSVKSAAEATAEAATESTAEKSAIGSDGGPENASPDTSGFVRSSPLARKIAQQNDLPLVKIKGSGPGGRIVKADVEKALATPGGAQSSAPQPASVVTGSQPSAGQPAATTSAFYAHQTPQDVVTPVSSKRRIIAQRLSESMYSAPHYYIKVPVEMDQIMASRSRLNARPDTKVSFNAFLVKFVAEALKKHPIVNATWTGDTIIQHGRIDIGLAVAQKDGLITPVVRDCGNKGIVQIEQDLKELIQKARNNALKPEEYTGATFTISNLGSYGVEEFTAIINPPGSAILAVGEIKREPVVGQNDAILIKSIMKMTLSCDHRVIDGSAGAAFLTELRDMLEEPVRTLY
jgi:pyruvate dehydrogenase E2 component (dihydrolipoamide acetyltransferase)